MGLRFRKSRNFGPFRASLSKSGLSTSVGVKGFRVTRTAKGRTRMTASLPGTGISYVKETGSSSPESAAGILKHAVRGYVFCVGFVVLIVLILGIFAASRRSQEKTATVALPAETAQAMTKAEAPRAMISEAPVPDDPVSDVADEKQEFILNTNTKKFHRLGCSSVSKIADKNREALETTREDLIRQGYDPCDVCRP